MMMDVRGFRGNCRKMITGEWVTGRVTVLLLASSIKRVTVVQLVKSKNEGTA